MLLASLLCVGVVVVSNFIFVGDPDDRTLALSSILAFIAMLMMEVVAAHVARQPSARARWWSAPVSRRTGGRIWEFAMGLWLFLAGLIIAMLVVGSFLRSKIGPLLLAVFVAFSWVAYSSARGSKSRSLKPYALWMTVALVVCQCILYLMLGSAPWKHTP
jgi:hypothetical protein